MTSGVHPASPYAPQPAYTPYPPQGMLLFRFSWLVFLNIHERIFCMKYKIIKYGILNTAVMKVQSKCRCPSERVPVFN